MKTQLIDALGLLLLRNGYTVKALKSTCFEILARKGKTILLIKVLSDANSLTKKDSEEIRRTASYFKAAPIAIVDHGKYSLYDNVVYERHELYTLNLDTFQHCLNEKFPMLISTSAGLTASIDGNKLRSLRERKGFSLERISRRIGVSRSMIQRYELNESKITFAKAKILYDIFGSVIFSEVNIFLSPLNKSKERTTVYSKHYEELGFDASDFSKTPFDIAAEKDGNLILTEIGDKVNHQLDEVAKLTDANNLVIFRSQKPRKRPSLSQKEFLEYEKASELIKFVGEFD